MRKAVLVSSHVPNPRLNKRIKSLSSFFDDFLVVFWRRDYGCGFSVDRSIKVEYKSIEAKNQRSLFRRFVDTKRLAYETNGILLSEGPDLIYVSAIEGMIPALKHKRMHGSKIILELGDLPAQSYLSRMHFASSTLEKYLNNLVAQADGLVLTSPYFYSDYYKNLTKIKHEDVFVFENVPERSVFSVFEKEPHDNLVVAFVGGIRYFESLQSLFAACSENNHIEILVAGMGPDYERVLKEANRYTNVKLTGRYNYSEEIAAIYSKVDLVYSVYSTDNLNEQLALPNRLYESIVCEIPILVAKNTRLEEYVKHLGVGFSVRDKDVGGLKDLINRIVSDPKLLSEASSRAADVKEMFYYDRVESNFLDWLSRYLMA